MITTVISVDPEKPDMAKIAAAGRIIKWGGVVAFPTETVYGLGADALNPVAVGRIFHAKNRPADNPLIVHVCRPEQAWDAGMEDGRAASLVEKFWPGPLTVVLRARDKVPLVTRGGLDTVAVRMPDNPVALALIEASSGVIAAPSANVSGRPSPTTPRGVIEDMDGKIEAIINGGPTKIGIESTVVDLSDPDGTPVLLRPGGTPAEDIEAFLGTKLARPDANGARRSPGMRYRHYAPSIPVRIWRPGESLPEDVKPSRWAFMGLHKPPVMFAANVTYNKLGDFASSLFRDFRLLDECGKGYIDGILIEWPPEDGIGLGLGDRIRRAAGQEEPAGRELRAERPAQAEQEE